MRMNHLTRKTTIRASLQARRKVYFSKYLEARTRRSVALKSSTEFDANKKKTRLTRILTLMSDLMQHSYNQLKCRSITSQAIPPFKGVSYVAIINRVWIDFYLNTNQRKPFKLSNLLRVRGVRTRGETPKFIAN